ncbi:hypothetical protein GH714_025079 [Hevea brasiliensis]|uniref:Cytochrome P450 n=1 Tax=Hevea brasiliensis TaxID=3981 RepID=A0A6A6NCH0_HEVBR|nr:hypothetical protein GH714_025079 [Hevea brasiliensis]
MLTIGLFLVGLLLTYYMYWINKWRNPKCNGILPPGSMGFPLIGETLQLLTTSYSLDLHPFIKKRVQRYGPIFRSNVAGRPIVVSTDPEFNHYILGQEERLVEIWYLDTFSKLFLSESRINSAGYIHKYIRSFFLSNFGSENLKEQLLPQIEDMINKTLRSWSNQPSVDVKYFASVAVCDFTAKIFFSYDAEKLPEKLSETFAKFIEGLISFPLNIPGTAYHQCLQDHRKAMTILKKIIVERRNTVEKRGADVLDRCLNDMEKEKFLTDDFICMLMFGGLFASSESISSITTLMFKFLSPSRSSSRVEGYTIPANWTIMMVTSACQINPDVYKDPLAFNPWRWKDIGSAIVSKNFTPFGKGTRQCAGAEFSKVTLSVFLHVLVTKYRWTMIKEAEVRRDPILGFGDGIQIKLVEN